jgi:hypothetical protein
MWSSTFIEELGLTILDPLGPCQGLAFWAMAVAAGVVGNALVLALIALFQVAAQSGGAAQFDGTHDAALGATLHVVHDRLRHNDATRRRLPAGDVPWAGTQKY